MSKTMYEQVYEALENNGFDQRFEDFMTDEVSKIMYLKPEADVDDIDQLVSEANNLVRLMAKYIINKHFND